MVGRLRPGLDRAGAERELTALAAEMATVSPLDRYGFTTLSLHDVLTRGSRQGLWILLGATGLVLLIACANVSNLLLARAMDRRREMAVRTAMGAGRGRLTAQLVTESVVLSLAGGVAGVALAGGLLRVVVALVPTGVPRLGAVGLDLRVLAVSLAVATLAGVLSGVLPALHAAAADPVDTLRGSASRGATAAGAPTASRLLVVAEIALSLMLVAASGLLVRSLQALGAQELGFSTAGVLTFSVTVPADADAAAGRARAVRVFETIVERIARAPGVAAAGAISLLPIAQTGNNGPIRIPERTIRPEESPLAELRAVTPGYFAAIGQPLVAGRGLDPRDRADAPPVVLLNETLAAQLWPRVPLRDVVGRRVGLGADRDGAWREVVGIVRDTRTRRPELPPDAETYVPHAQLPVRTLSLVVRGAGDPASLAPVVRAAVADVDPTLAVATLRPFGDVIEGAIRPARLTTLLTTGFGVLALGLAAIGIYSVLSHAVVRRARELGVRAALGASPSSLMRLVLREGVVLTGFGMLGGAAGAIGLSSVLVGVLYQVSPTDPLVLAGAGVTVATVAALGYLVPAWRAAGVAPAVALRFE